MVRGNFAARAVVVGGILAITLLAALFIWLPGNKGTQISSQTNRSGASGIREALPFLGVAPTFAAESSQPAGIVVAGQGIVKAEPDVAYVNAGVRTRGSTAQDAQEQNATLMTAVVTKLQSMGYAKKDIRTSGVSVQPVYDRQGSGPTSYQAINQVVVTVNDVTQAGTVYDATVAAGANVAGNMRFGLKEDAPLRQQALREAVKAARAKADALAAEMGVRITGITAVIEESAGGMPYPVMEAAPAMEDRSAPPTPIIPGELSVSASVKVIYQY